MEQNLLTNILLSALGLAGYTLWVVRKHIKERTFSWSIFINDNKAFWIWVILCQATYSAVFYIIPELEKAVATRVSAIINGILQTDFEFPDNIVIPVAYLSGAWLLSMLVNKGMGVGNKIGKDKVK